MSIYSGDGQWHWDGERWQPVQGPLPPDARDPDGNPVTAESATATRVKAQGRTAGEPDVADSRLRAADAAAAAGRDRARYTSWGSRELGEIKWFIAGCAWSVYAVLFALLGFHLLQSAISPPPPPSTMAVQLGVAQPENIGADVFVGLLAWVAASLAGIYAYRIWTRRARWIFVVIPLIF
jgi:hypothetical protein